MTREVIYQHEDHAAAEGGSSNRRLRLQQSACQGKIQQGRAVCPQTGREVSRGGGEGVALSKEELPPLPPPHSPRISLLICSAFARFPAPKSSAPSHPLTITRAVCSAPLYLPQISFNFSGHFLSVSSRGASQTHLCCPVTSAFQGN